MMETHARKHGTFVTPHYRMRNVSRFHITPATAYRSSLRGFPEGELNNGRPPFSELIQSANLLVRLLLEVCALGAFGYWGYHASSNRAISTILAIGAPTLAAVVRAMLASPNALRTCPEG